MKILVISDVHENWVFALSFIKANKDFVDYVVTLGDYVDSFNESLNGFPMQQGFLELVSLARKEPNKFRILIGNHDQSYISKQTCSGHKYQYEEMYKKMFLDNIDLLEPVVMLDDILFSHAGVSLDWYENILDFYNEKHKYDFVPKDLKKEYDKWKYKYSNICDVYFDGIILPLTSSKSQEKQYNSYKRNAKEKMNLAWDKMKVYFKNTLPEKFSVDNLRKIFLEDYNNLNHCGYSPNGNSSRESCIWIRPESLLKDRWPRNIKCQVVGHTEIGLKKIKYRQHKLIVCDNRTHNCGFILDTENLGDFEKIEFE